MLASKNSTRHPTTHIQVICHLAETAIMDCQTFNYQLSSPAHRQDELLHERACSFMEKEQISLQRYRCYIETWRHESLIPRQNEWLESLKHDLTLLENEMGKLGQLLDQWLVNSVLVFQQRRNSIEVR